MAVVAFPGDEEFAELVNSDARHSASDHESEWLRSPEVVEAWYNQIILLLNRVDAQLSHHKAERAAQYLELYNPEDNTLYMQYIRQADTWRANALWFKKTLLDRLMEAKTLKNSQVDEVGNYTGTVHLDPDTTEVHFGDD